MKKLFCLLLAVMLLATCFAGCKKNPDDVSSLPAVTDNDNTQEEFKKPENYASVVLVTINPQFRLYLDASGTVLAVEPVNKDAKAIEKKVSFKDQKVDAVVSNLIVAANDGGFVKKDAKIDIKVTEVVDKTVVATEILKDIKESANDKLTELEIKAEVTTEVKLENEDATQSETTDTSSVNSTTSTTSKPNKTEKPQETPKCKHTNVIAKSVSTGSNIIDGTKSDVVNHAKVCKDCGVQIAVEKHTVSNGKCTVCGQSNLAVEKITADAAGITGATGGNNAAEINSDGTPDYDFMVQEAYYAIGYETLQKYLNEEEWVYKVPEAEFLKALKTKFVIDDNLFAKIKAQGEYKFFWSDHSYSNGIFYIAYTAMGDVADYTHNLIGYKDNKKGSFTIYYDYIKGGPDIEEAERVHQFYYAIEYTYSGASNLWVEKIDDDGYIYYDINGWVPVVDSMRIKSIKKVTDISGITTVK